MAKAQRSGITVNPSDVPLILGMVARGDRRHDIAAWFGLNQGRIKEVEDGKHGTPSMAAASSLPPSGSPGPKARALRRAIRRAYLSLQKSPPDTSAAMQELKKATDQFDKNE